MAFADANSQRGQVRALVERHGALNAQELAALLPKVLRKGEWVYLKAREIGRIARTLATRDKLLVRREDGRFALGKPPITRAEHIALTIARNMARGAAQAERRRLEVPKTPKQGRPTAAQKAAISYPQVAANGLPPRQTDPRPAPLPSSDDFLAAGGKIQRLARGDVSPASRFQRLKVAA